jgi:predicted metal-dependent peptidase
MDNVNDETRMKVAKFRTSCKAVVPYLTQTIYGLIPVRAPGCKTMAVDQYGRLYYDPSYVNRVTPETGRWTILHEVLHVVLGHCRLGKRVLGDNPTAQMCLLWNIACDIVVNQLLDAWGQDAPEGVYTYQRMGFPPKLSAIEYYRLLVQQEEEKQQQREQQQESDDSESDDEQDEDDSTSEEDDDDDQQQGDGDRDGDSESDEPGDEEGEDDAESGAGSDSEDGEEDASSDGEADGDEEDGEADGAGGEGGDGEESGDQSGDGGDAEPVEGAGGSGADGQPRSYELPPDAGHADREYSMVSELEKAIEEQEAKAPGSVPGELKAAVEFKLRPQPDPFDVLRAAVARAVATPLGSPDYTFRRLSRRQGDPNGPRLRGIKKEMPNVVVLLDTSGSMGWGYDHDLTTRALDCIAKGVRRLQSVRVICGDAALHNDQVVRSVGRMKIEGGGGTDMGQLIEQLDKEVRPDAILVVTDLETAWCDKPRAKVVIAGVKAPCDYYPVPAWAKFVDLTKKGGG